MTSSCKNCMALIRLITLECMRCNSRVFAKHVRSTDNGASDALSRFQMERFDELTRHKSMNKLPEVIPAAIWLIEKIWLKC